MAEETSEKVDLQELLKCCDDTLSVLNNFSGRLDKIIEVKKKMAAEAAGDMAFNQGKGAMDAVANLEKINTMLLSAIGEIKLLNQQALSLTKPPGLKSDAALSDDDSHVIKHD